MALVHHWPLTDGSGTTAVDIVGANNGTLANGPQWLAGGGLRFAGYEGLSQAQYVYTTQIVSLANAPMAVMAKFTTTVASGTKMICIEDAANADSSFHDRSLYVGTNGRLYGQIHTGGTSVELYSMARVNDGQEHHAALQYTGSAVELWLDGTKVHEKPATSIYSSTSPNGWRWKIGGIDGGASVVLTNSSRVIEGFQGDLRDVRFYSNALTSAEIAEISGPAPTPIPVHWSIPTGVEVGKGVINIVNCKLRGVWLQGGIGLRYAQWSQDAALARLPLDLYARYIDMICQTSGKELAAMIQWGSGYSEIGGEGWYRASNFVWADSISQNAQWLFGADYLDRAFVEIQAHDVKVVEDFGPNVSNFGTSQYPTGFAPVPTERVINVSPGEHTLYNACVAAAHNDNLVLAPGTYYVDEFHESGYTIDKAIRIYGATEDPDDVLLCRTSGFNPATYVDEGFIVFRPYKMTNCPEGYRGPGLFHLTVQRQSTEAPNYQQIVTVRTTPYEIDYTPWVPPGIIVSPTGVQAAGSAGTPTVVTYATPPAVRNALMFSCNT